MEKKQNIIKQKKGGPCGPPFFESILKKELVFIPE